MAQPAPAHPFRLVPGARIGTQYEVQKCLGQGGMGEVLLASDLELDRDVAIKVVRRDLAAKVEVDAQFRREARMLSRLNHPNVVVIHAFGHVPPDLHYIVMEMVAGESLEARIERERRLDPGTFNLVMAQVCSAVAEAHRQGIVHRDLKPGNVLLTSVAGNPDYVKVVDFGLARVFAQAGEGLSESSDGERKNAVGTPHYMSPEQIQSMDVDGRADVYALGVMACELLTGKMPFEAGNLLGLLIAHVQDDPKLPSELLPEAGFPRGEGVDAVIERALAKDPAERYETAEQLAEELLIAVADWSGVEPRAPRITDSYVMRPRTTEEALRQQESRRSTTAPRIARESALRVLARDTLSTPDSPEAARVVRNVAVLQLEVVSDPYREDLDVEEYLECLGLVRARIHNVLISRGGVLVGPLTDRQLAVFGLDPGEENVTEAAVDAALAVRAALAALRDDPAVPPAFEITVRVGVDAGRTFVADSDASGTVLFGPPVFGARDQAQAAAPGEVRISHAAYRRARGLYEHSIALDSAFDAAPSGYLIEKKNALAVALAADEIHGVRIDLRGRDEELETLRAAYRGCVRERRAQAVLVAGPPGVGKNRLASELVRELDDAKEPIFIESGRCTARAEGRIYEPFIEALRSRARIAPEDKPADVCLKTEIFVRRHLAQDPTELSADERRLADLLLTFLGARPEPGERLTLPPEPQELIATQRLDHARIGAQHAEHTGSAESAGSAEPAGSGEPIEGVRGEQAQRAVLFDAAARVFRGLASRHPVLFLIKDLHLASEPTRQLLAHVLERVADVPVCVVLTARTESTAPPNTSFVRDQERLTAVRLDPLPDEAMTDLVRHALRRLVEVPGALVRRVVELAEGMPLIAVEAVHDLVDEGVIVPSDRQWRLRGDKGGRLSLPESVEQLFSARFKRLDPRHRAALEAASVVGRTFWRPLVGELCGEHLTRGDVTELLRRGIVEETGASKLAGEHAYAFARAAAQEVIYRGVRPSRRRSLHLKAAEWLERQAGARAEEHAGTLAYHLHQAGEATRALPYARTAARRAVDAFALDEAIEQLRLCLALIDALPARDKRALDPGSAQAALVGELVHQLVLAGRLQEAVEASESWKSDGEERAPAAAGILIDRGQALERLGRYREAREAFRRAGELGSDDEDLLARARIGEAGSTMKLGDPAVAAVMLGETIAGMAPASGKPSPAASETRCRAERVLANALLRQHELEWAETSYRKALELAREVNAPEEIVDAQNGLAALSYFRGEPEQAESTWRAALETAETWDLTQHRAVLLGNIGEMELTRGRLDDAFQTLRRAEALHAYLGSDEGLAEASRLLGECSLALGDRSEAEGHARRALEVADRLGAPQYLGAAHRTMARVLKAAASAGGEDRSAEADVHLEAAAAAFRLAGLEEAARSAELLKGE